jgi:hypothetical protein
VTEPTRSGLTFWRQPAKGGQLEWSWAQERLEAAPDYWLATVAVDGRPSSRPVWGVWLDGRLLLTIGSTTHWRNLAHNAHVSVTLGHPLDVVIVEGVASAEKDRDVLARMIEPYNAKYDWNFTVDNFIGGLAAVEPTVVLAWASAPSDVNSQDTFPLASARWTF